MLSDRKKTALPEPKPKEKNKKMNENLKQYGQNMKLYGVLLLVIAVATAATYAILKWLFPSLYFTIFPLLPIYFLLMGFSQIMMFQVWKDATGKQFFTIYMITRFLKILLSVVVAFLGYYFLNQNKEVFLAVFVFFYFVHLAFETWVFTQKLKENKAINSNENKASNVEENQSINE